MVWLIMPFLCTFTCSRTFLREGGAELENFFVNTPVCCPSRTTLLSGSYPHNWHTTGSPNCMHMNVTSSLYRENTIGVHMKKLGYSTGMFGKFLNPDGMEPYCKDSPGEPQTFRSRISRKHPVCDDALQPLPGFDHWLAMCNDFCFYENVFNANGVLYKTGTDPKDYLTSVIGNATADFVETSLKSGKPFFAYVAPHAPHIPATPAPWYEDVFKDRKAPRTENYNFSALDHHYVVRMQQPITETVAQDIDLLFQDRWRSLLSVDDITIALVDIIEKYGELNNTYFVFTSDHGFQLGQFRLPSCKLQPYEHDIRVPFFIRGPGIPPGSTFSFVASMVDIAPTLLSLAGAKSASLERMDGRSFSDLLFSYGESSQQEKEEVWTDKVMLEYWSLENVTRYGHYIDLPNNTFIGVRLLNETHNFLYVEFYSTDNVTAFKWPLEYELFDISKDPYQMHNLYGTTEEDKSLVHELHDYLHWQVFCRGQDQCL